MCQMLSNSLRFEQDLLGLKPSHRPPGSLLRTDVAVFDCSQPQ